MFEWLKSSKKVVAPPPELAEVLETHLTGLRTEAEKGYLRLLKEDPQSAVVAFLLAAVRVQLGNLAGIREQLRGLMAAEDIIARVTTPLQSLYGSEPARLVALLLEVGDDLRRYNTPEEATFYFRIAGDLDPGQPEAWYRLGDCLHDFQLYDEARKALDTALAADPNHWASCYTYAVLLQDVGCDAEAIDFYYRALALKDDHAKCQNNLGSALLNSGLVTEALPHFQRAVELDPKFAQAYVNLGTVLNLQGSWHDATAALEKAMHLNGPAGTWVKHALIMPAVPSGAEEIEKARDHMQRELESLVEQGLPLTDPLREVGLTPSRLAYHGRDDLPLMRQLADFYLTACPQLDVAAVHCEALRAGPSEVIRMKIRIGFVSTFMFDHSIGRYYRQVIEKLSRDKFHVTVISTFPKNDPVAEAIAEAADACIQVPMHLAAAQQMIADAQLDMLVYCDVGLEPLSYFLAFSRLAPVQVAGCGHPSTSGIPNLDYFLSHQACEPEDWDDHYNEKPLLLSPQVPYTYHEVPEAGPNPKPRAALSLDPAAHLYLCPQAPFEIHPDQDQLLAQILEADPQGQLVFFASQHATWNDQLQRRLAAAIPDCDARVKVLPGMTQDDYLDILRQADVILDTLHYNGSAPVLDGLALGTPVVTLPGAFMRGRQTLGCYGKLGVEECVAGNAEEYVKKAVEIASNPQLRSELSRRILAAGPQFFGNSDFVKELEALLEGVA